MMQAEDRDKQIITVDQGKLIIQYENTASQSLTIKAESQMTLRKEEDIMLRYPCR